MSGTTCTLTERQSLGEYRLTPAQKRVLAFLRADESGDFIYVPFEVTRSGDPLENLEKRGLIESEIRDVKTGRGTEPTVFHRAVRS